MKVWNIPGVHQPGEPEIKGKREGNKGTYPN